MQVISSPPCPSEAQLRKPISAGWRKLLSSSKWEKTCKTSTQRNGIVETLVLSNSRTQEKNTAAKRYKILRKNIMKRARRQQLRKIKDQLSPSISRGQPIPSWLMNALLVCVVYGSGGLVMCQCNPLALWLAGVSLVSVSKVRPLGYLTGNLTWILLSFIAPLLLPEADRGKHSCLNFHQCTPCTPFICVSYVC